MSASIVERLRAMENDMVGPYRALALEAAAEIERWQTWVDVHQKQIGRLEAEIERLREENMFLRSLVADKLMALEP